MGALGLLVGAPHFARASHSSSNVIEQYWELGAEKVTATSTLSVEAPRGTIPGGTTKFSPQPTQLVFAAVGRHTGGSSGSSWTVTLKDASGTSVASVSFGSSDITTTTKTSTASWPATDLNITTLQLDKGPGAGTLEVTKAYLKIRQSGAISKTIGRVPLAAKETVTWTGFADAGSTGIYRHAVADFDPPPAIRLRATGAATPGRILNLRLVDDSGAEVSGSRLTFEGSTEAKETSALTLGDGVEYRLQAGMSLPGSSSGFMINADLALDQSTTDPHGVKRTVGWYPGVIAPVDMTTNGSILGFQVHGPNIAAPEVSSCFRATLKRLTGSGTVAVQLANLTTGDTEAATAATTSASLVALDTSDVGKTAASDVLDTATLVSGATGRITSSLLCKKIHLHDTLPPEFATNLAASNPSFSPNADGVKDFTDFSATLADYSPVTWTLAIKNGSGTTVKTITGSGSSVLARWSGEGSSTDGIYTGTLTATDVAGNVNSQSVDVTRDTAAPSVSSFAVSEERFSPNGDGILDSVVFSGSFSEPGPWTLQVKNPAEQAISSYAGSGASMSQSWNGSGATTDGEYIGRVSILDAAGNSSSGAVSVDRDVTGPTIADPTVTTPYFSPNGDGQKDTTTFTASISDSWSPLTWQFLIRDANNATVRTVSGSSSAPFLEWNGSDATGKLLPEGFYSILLIARDGGSSPSFAERTAKLDLTPPGLAAPEVYPNPFVPESAEPRNRAHLTATLSEALAWSIGLLDAHDASVRNFTGSGSEIDVEWDGTDGSGVRVADGAYQIRITSTDAAANELIETLWNTVGGGPVISSLSSTSVQIGDELRILGSGFGIGSGLHGVTIADVPAFVSSWSDSEIRVHVPPDVSPGEHDLAVWAGDITAIPTRVRVLNYVLPAASDDLFSGRISAKLVPGASSAAVAVAHGDPTPTSMAPDHNTHPVLSRWWEIEVPVGQEEAKIIEYAADPSVEWVEHQRKPSPDSTYPNDPDFEEQWGLDQASDFDIDAPEAWDITQGAGEFNIAIIDSGIGPHADLAENIEEPGRDYTGTNLNDGCEGAAGSHGTAVAGVASAATNNSRGVAGTGWRSDVRPYKVFNNVGGVCRWDSDTALYRVIRAAAHDNNDVISMSLGSQTYHQAEQDETRHAYYDHHRVLVAAAGNENSNRPHYPAAYTGVIAVGAFNQSGLRASFSNYGDWVDVFAPGQDIHTTTLTDAGAAAYGDVNGTSFAAPFVSGTAALLWTQADDQSDVASAIKSTAEGSLRRLSAYAALLRLHPVVQPNGTFVRQKGTSAVYLLDGGARRHVISSRILDSWAVTSSQIAELEDEQLDRFASGSSLGFRHGTLLSPQTNLVDPDPLNTFAVTTDRGSSSNNLKWTRGFRRQILVGVFDCLGYDHGRVIPVSQTEADLHSGAERVASCTQHPNGAMLKHSNGAIYVLEAGTKRNISSSKITDSWGMRSDFARQSALVDLELTGLPSGLSVGFRPGSVVRSSSNRLWVITSDGSDFPRSEKRHLQDSESSYRTFRCYGFTSTSIIIDSTTALLSSLHGTGADLNC